MVDLPTSLVVPLPGVVETVGSATLQPRCVAYAGWWRHGIRPVCGLSTFGRGRTWPLDVGLGAERGLSTFGWGPNVASRRSDGGRTWPPDVWNRREAINGPASGGAELAVEAVDLVLDE